MHRAHIVQCTIFFPVTESGSCPFYGTRCSLSHKSNSWKQHIATATGRLLERLVRNEEVSEKTALQKVELIIKERRLTGLSQVPKGTK